MDLEKMARDLGAAIQKDARYLRFQETHDANEHDADLTDMINKLQLVHMSYQHEAAKETPDEDKLHGYEEEFNALYRAVSANEHMQAYEAARDEMDKLMKFLTGILTLCVRGEDPYTCDPNAQHECGGDCSSCGGCH